MKSLYIVSYCVPPNTTITRQSFTSSYLQILILWIYHMDSLSSFNSISKIWNVNLVWDSYTRNHKWCLTYLFRVRRTRNKLDFAIAMLDIIVDKKAIWIKLISIIFISSINAQMYFISCKNCCLIREKRKWRIKKRTRLSKNALRLVFWVIHILWVDSDKRVLYIRRMTNSSYTTESFVFLFNLIYGQKRILL